MKQVSPRLPLCMSLALIMCAMTACKTSSQAERPHVCTVVAIGGEARFWDGQSNAVHVIKNGDQIPQGSIIETAKGIGNYVDLALGKRRLTVYSNYPYVFEPSDSVRVNEDSVVKLDKVAVGTAGKQRTLDARLRLLRSSILMQTLAGWQEAHLQARVIAPKQDKSYWELKGSNAVLRAQGGTIWFSASGSTTVLWGTATLDRINEKATVNLTDGQQYDAVTGDVVPIDEGLRSELMTGADFPPPARLKGPRFPVPQRPF